MSPGAGDELRRPAHPERRAVEVGQRRRAHSKVYTVYAIEGRKAIVCQAGEVDSVDGYVHKGDSHCCYESVSVLADCELLPDVPAAAPLAADTPNKALPKWTMTALDPGSQRMADQLQKYINEIYQYAQPSYFIPANTWTPPLAAQPAETAHDECCEPGCSTSCPARKPAPQPAPACAHGCSDTQANTACPTHGKPAPAKPACERGANLHGGPVLLRCTGKGLFRKLCEHCYLAIEPLQKGPVGDVLHESDVPERLGRPKLAHSAMWADEAEDVR
jgi:hypothetical protein